VNFNIFNTTTNSEVSFAFRERSSPAGKFDVDFVRQRSDDIIFLTDGDTVASWQVNFIISASGTDTIMPRLGDSLILKLNKPFLNNDTLQLTNPYIITNSWEPHNPYSNGRGPRELHFTHLPAQCTIRIFNARGQLVNTIIHNTSIDDGTEIWNMLSRDNLDIAYGIYVYHVEAEGLGEKIGKFVVIK
jgi:hypothetical protein